MGYKMFVDADITTSRSLEVAEQAKVGEITNLEITANDFDIIFKEDYEGLCPNDDLKEYLDKVIEYGKEAGFTLDGTVNLDMTAGLCGREEWTIENSNITIESFDENDDDEDNDEEEEGDYDEDEV